MMNSFYSVSELEQEDGSLSCTLHYNAAHKIFEGHFPGNPIVPGVCTMAIVKEQLEKAVGHRLRLKESKTVKFLSLITPTMSPRLTVNWKEESGRITTTATLQESGTPLFKMSGTYILTDISEIL